MFSIWNSFGWEVPLALLLLGLMGFRFSLTPRTSVLVKAPPEQVFKHLDIHDGKINVYGRTTIQHILEDEERQIYRHIYSTTIMGGVARSFSALFRISERVPGRRIVLTREGLEGKSHASELMKIEHELLPEAGGTRFKTAYHWGPRPLLAQVTARSDLWGGTFRLKSLIETGVADETPYNLISAGVAIVTGLITLATFSLFLGWKLAMLAVFVLLIHEFGHLLAYRLIGQPWGKLMFLPFLGAIAMPRLPFESQSQAVFAALMGPGFSTLLALACTAPYLWSGTLHPMLAILGLFTVGINIFNMVPAEPLDGGIALRSVLSRMIGRFARFGLLAIGLGIIALGFLFSQVILVIFGGIAVLANIKDRKIDFGLEPLTSLQVTISAFSYVAMGSAYVTLYKFFSDRLASLSSIAS